MIRKRNEYCLAEGETLQHVDLILPGTGPYGL
jgi:hypothetical protein